MLNEVLSSEAIYIKVDEMRREKKWSLYRLAKESNLSRSAIYNWRDNKSQPTLYLLECVSEAFKIPVITLLFDSETLTATSQSERELLNDWYALNYEQKIAVKKVMKLFKKK